MSALTFLRSCGFVLFFFFLCISWAVFHQFWQFNYVLSIFEKFSQFQDPSCYSLVSQGCREFRFMFPVLKGFAWEVWVGRQVWSALLLPTLPYLQDADKNIIRHELFNSSVLGNVTFHQRLLWLIKLYYPEVKALTTAPRCCKLHWNTHCFLWFDNWGNFQGTNHVFSGMAVERVPRPGWLPFWPPAVPVAWSLWPHQAVFRS